MKSQKYGNLTVNIYESRHSAGIDAAHRGAEIIKRLLEKQEYVNIIFAAAPSQNDTLEALINEKGVDWSRCRAFHMDEYVGFPKEKRESFGSYLNEHIFSHLPFASVNYINGAAKAVSEEVARYTELLIKYPTDIVFLGIGENAHIAFNDPGVADFNDSRLVKLVRLDEKCRKQQVHDGCFPTLDDVPCDAFTLTVPALFRAKSLICTVPCATKADAVRLTAEGEISEKIPASIMRLHSDAVMYCDKESGKYLL